MTTKETLSGVTVDGYYCRFDAGLEYEKLLMREGKTTQATEINDLQESVLYRLRRVADVLMKDGNVIRDAAVIVDPETGNVRATAGDVYLLGAVRSVPEATFTIPNTGTVAIGVRIVQTVISEKEDPSLRCPAKGSRGEGDPGAWRLKLSARWGHDHDGESGTFFPIYTVDDGIVRAKETPPSIDGTNTSIARYDVDSTGGGTYVCRGLHVIGGDPLSDGRQVYHVGEGSARVRGFAVDMLTSRRVVHDAKPDTRLIETESHPATADAASGMRITVSHPPLGNVGSLRITARKTATIVHGQYSGAPDALPDTSVVAIEKVVQGMTTYTPETDYIKTGDTVDWSPSGNEPTSGSSYEVTYTYMTTVEPEAQDADGFTVTGAVEGSYIYVTYTQNLPRYDRLALTADGGFKWICGVASELNPQVPAVPDTMVALCTVYQNWRPGHSIENDAVTVMPFSRIAAMEDRLDFAISELMRNRLESSVATQESGMKVGLFVDSLIDDTRRDQGIAQTAAVVEGALMLPIAGLAVHMFAGDVKTPTARPYTTQTALEQTLRTGDMAVNPYMAFSLLPAPVTLTPAIDQWTEVLTTWASPVTQRFRATRDGGWRIFLRDDVSTTTNVISSSTKALEYLREIDITFDIEGFGSGETLESVTFDGIEVTPAALS